MQTLCIWIQEVIGEKCSIFTMDDQRLYDLLPGKINENFIGRYICLKVSLLRRGIFSYDPLKSVMFFDETFLV